MFFALILGVFIYLIIWDHLYKRRANELFKQSGISGPPTVPVVGNLFSVLNNTTENVFGLMQYFRDTYGKIWRMWFFHERVIVVQDPKFIESILSSQQVIKKNILYDLLLPWLGEGLLISTGSKWHTRRKIITPTFHFKILEQYVEIFDQQSNVMAKRLYERADGKTVIDMFPEACLTALDIISETAMGVKVNAQTNPNFPYAKAVTEASMHMSNRFVRPAQRFNLVFRLFHPIEAIKIKKHIALMHKFTEEVIEERRKALESSKADGTFQNINDEINNDDVGLKKRMAFLDVLLQATVNGKPLSNADIREEVDTFMFEGHDTTTSGIAHTLYLIARHPEVQKKLVEEIHEVIGTDKTKPITMRDLQDLKYLECVVKESLRLFPPVPAIARITEADVVLNGQTIPANTNVMLLIYAASRDPDYFTDPDAFKPERFSADAVEKINPFAYVPFSAGPRNCVGQKFAMLELKSTVSKMLRHFELLPLGGDVRRLMTMILRSGNGINVGLKPRK